MVTGSLPATAIDGIGEVEFVRLLVVVSCEIWISLVTETEPVQLFAVLRLIPPWGPPPWVLLPPFEEELSKLLQLLAVLACCNPTVTDGMFLLFVVVIVSTMVLALLLLLGLEIESPLESWS